jgi:hypothetical protein
VIKAKSTLVSRKFFVGILLATGIISAFPAAAIESLSPIVIGLFPPVQFPGTEFGVTGLRLTMVGVNREARGFDLGILGNVTNQTFKGAAIAGLFNYNRVSADIIGFQLAAIANINGTSSRLYGFQIGLFNKVSKVYGLQVGLFNVAHELHGFQIGLLNFNKAGPFKASPIINAAF